MTLLRVVGALMIIQAVALPFLPAMRGRRRMVAGAGVALGLAGLALVLGPAAPAIGGAFLLAACVVAITRSATIGRRKAGRSRGS
jgi:hypothetical protein